MLEPGAGDRELTLRNGGPGFDPDTCGLCYEDECKPLCHNPSAYVVTSTAYAPVHNMRFYVCEEHAYLVRSMMWFESMRSLPRD